MTEKIFNVFCTYCGKLLYRPPYRKKKYDRFFCNNACKNALIHNERYIKYGYCLVSVRCVFCGSEIKRKNSHAKNNKLNFCDRICKGQYQSGDRSGIRDINYKNKYNIICQYCGKKTYKKPSMIKNFQYHFCNNVCYAKWNVGINNGRWIKDRSKLKSSIRETVVQFTWYKKWIKSVYKRDDHACKRCGCNDKVLHAHHIISFASIIDDLSNNDVNLLLSNKKIPDILIDINNGITLCEKCHFDIKGKENEYIDIFCKMVIA